MDIFIAHPTVLFYNSWHNEERIKGHVNTVGNQKEQCNDCGNNNAWMTNLMNLRQLTQSEVQIDLSIFANEIKRDKVSGACVIYC